MPETVDFRPTFLDREDPVEGLLQRLLGLPGSPILNSVFRALRQRIARQLQRNGQSPLPHERCLPRSQQGGAGHVDDVLIRSNNTGVVVGWAADMVTRRPAIAIHVFANGLWITRGILGQLRPDVAEYYNDGRLERCGFSINLTFFKEEHAAVLSVYSELRDGTFFELQKP